MLFVSGVSLFLVSACSNQNFTDKPELTMLIVGDSLSASYQINPKTSWTHLLQDKFDENLMNVKIINISKSGDTTGDALNKSEEHLAANADIVLLNIGANDALKKIPINKTKDNLVEMIEYFNHSPKKPKIMLVNIKPPAMISLAAPHIKAYTEIIPEFSNTYKVPYIEDFFAGLNTSFTSNKHFLGDKIHPNETAQPIIVDTVYKAVKPLIIQRHNKE